MRYLLCAEETKSVDDVSIYMISVLVLSETVTHDIYIHLMMFHIRVTDSGHRFWSYLRQFRVIIHVLVISVTISVSVFVFEYTFDKFTW